MKKNHILKREVYVSADSEHTNAYIYLILLYYIHINLLAIDLGIRCVQFVASPAIQKAADIPNAINRYDGATEHHHHHPPRTLGSFISYHTCMICRFHLVIVVMAPTHTNLDPRTNTVATAASNLNHKM